MAKKPKVLPPIEWLEPRVRLMRVVSLACFADRSFYDAWWNCVSWDQFARDWNRPVHNFLLRHVYHSSISAMKVDKHTATLITFFLSACVQSWRNRKRKDEGSHG